MQDHDFEPGSFRDRNGRVFYKDGEVYRWLSEKALENWKNLSTTHFFESNLKAGKIVSTRQIGTTPHLQNEGDLWAACLVHQKIQFISYPYEWSFSMLRDAAVLHLDLLLDALDEDMILKDSSSYNIQWNGPRPVFIDTPSFENLPDGSPWIGYRQFCQLFLYPLMLQSYTDVDFHPWLRGNIDGIDSVQINNILCKRDLFRPGVFSNVYLQAKFQNRFSNSSKNIKQELKSAGFSKELICTNVRKLRKLVKGLYWGASKSEWSSYAKTHSYSDSDHLRKADFVGSVVTHGKYHLAWDVGCNTGHFSRIIAAHVDYVVSMDSDHLCIDRLYQALKDEKVTNILPLISNLADPSPNLGWRGMERKSLSERGEPDLVVCLAVIHHAVIGCNIPLSDFVNWLRSLNSEVIVEFITKDDAMVETLLRNKEDEYDDYTLCNFESLLAAAFNVTRSEQLASNTRKLYHIQPN